MSSARKWTLWQVPVLLGKKKRKRYFTGTRRGGGSGRGRLLFHSIQGRKFCGGGRRRRKSKEIGLLGLLGRKAPEAACEGGFKFFIFLRNASATSAAPFATGRLGRSMISPGPVSGVRVSGPSPSQRPGPSSRAFPAPKPAEDQTTILGPGKIWPFQTPRQVSRTPDTLRWARLPPGPSLYSGPVRLESLNTVR